MTTAAEEETANGGEKDKSFENGQYAKRNVVEQRKADGKLHPVGWTTERQLPQPIVTPKTEPLEPTGQLRRRRTQTWRRPHPSLASSSLETIR
ncbi:hypothetical protein HPP92_023286 [Vanilla planifolia]|uniref:Uncharacterized protein n=1 Tax=Vanilla planifolia TaxID=51239 RepID=A0A835PV12_VANPL|nr:hypothetical protein HPP92_023286 [Vanilla planifolia]